MKFLKSYFNDEKFDQISFLIKTLESYPDIIDLINNYLLSQISRNHHLTYNQLPLLIKIEEQILEEMDIYETLEHKESLL